MVTLRGWYKYWWLTFYYSLDQMKMATLHEVFHTYGVDHVNEYIFIMSNTIALGGWKLHSDTNTAVNNDIDHYDSPP